jgi:hypothetical protein
MFFNLFRLNFPINRGFLAFLSSLIVVCSMAVEIARDINAAPPNRNRAAVHYKKLI